MKSKTKDTGIITQGAAHNIVERHQPKPTKAEVIEALVMRSYEKVKAAAELYNSKYAELTQKIEDEAKRIAKVEMENLKCEVNVYHNGQVNVTFTVRDPRITAWIVERTNLSRPVWCEKTARLNIKKAMLLKKPSNLLDDPEAVKAMDAMLAAWGI